MMQWHMQVRVSPVVVLGRAVYLGTFCSERYKMREPQDKSLGAECKQADFCGGAEIDPFFLLQGLLWTGL